MLPSQLTNVTSNGPWRSNPQSEVCDPASSYSKGIANLEPHDKLGFEQRIRTKNWGPQTFEYHVAFMPYKVHVGYNKVSRIQPLLVACSAIASAWGYIAIVSDRTPHSQPYIAFVLPQTIQQGQWKQWKRAIIPVDPTLA